ncbi:unnamed protein product [Bursaphelenchus xylophilus]|uniref:(pine wood nematode) hypothetical protein n=1 Tax=Bursaphelenchus xylophilus TaxID=6326 RepID=A0A7I8WM70_BURXY|nr:unnamed protein product [Bursaphelenchus xylophilus]CAG9104551.1 unnamed protein product [Bursaphelenchus xylophilus]
MLNYFLSLTFTGLVAAEYLDFTPRNYDVRATGTLYCEDTSETHKASIILADIDFLYDDILNWTVAGKDGKFDIYGTEWGFTKFEPVLYIAHHCGDWKNILQSRVVLDQKYVFYKSDEFKLVFNESIDLYNNNIGDYYEEDIYPPLDKKKGYF